VAFGFRVDPNVFMLFQVP